MEKYSKIKNSLIIISAFLLIFFCFSLLFNYGVGGGSAPVREPSTETTEPAENSTEDPSDNPPDDPPDNPPNNPPGNYFVTGHTDAESNIFIPNMVYEIKNM